MTSLLTLRGSMSSFNVVALKYRSLSFLVSQSIISTSCHHSGQCSRSKAHRRTPWNEPSASIPVKRTEALSISSLVQAGACRARQNRARKGLLVPQHRTISTLRLGKLSSTNCSLSHTPQDHSLPSHYVRPDISAPLTRLDYINFLDYYTEPNHAKASEVPFTGTLGLPSIEAESQSTEAPKEELKPRPREEEDNGKGDRTEAVKQLVELIRDKGSRYADIVAKYRSLPHPGFEALNGSDRARLLNRLSVVEKMDMSKANLYISIFEDVKHAGLPISISQWNSAIYLLGRAARPTDLELESALRAWKEMEEDARVKADTVTFNILIDLAAKVGRWAIADMMLQEMDARKLDPNRWSRTSRIFHCGLRGDGDGVRQAYKKLVEDGEVVNATVLNCVISALLHAGEPEAAENVYGRMRSMFNERSGYQLPVAMDWREHRNLAKVLHRSARAFKNDPDMLAKLQDQQLLAPNRQTFTCFLSYYVKNHGEIGRIAALLEEMQSLGIRPHNRVFIELFRGFTTHGGIRYTSWTLTRLNTVWEAYQDILETQEDQEDRIYAGKWIVRWVLAAFGKCDGPQRAEKIWDQLRSRWSVDPESEEVAQKELSRAKRRRR